MLLNKKDNGLLYDIQQYTLENSWVPQPTLCISAALCVVSTLINRKVIFKENCCNIYCLNVAPSGSGKDAPQQAAKNILLQLGLNNMLGAGDYVSDASLMNTLNVAPVRLDVIDEAAGFLATATHSGAAYASKVDDILCELYTTSNGYYAGRQLADSRKGECLRPFINLLMSTTPRGFEQGLSIKAVDKGLLGRNLLFFGDPDVKGVIANANFNLPLQLKDKMLALASYIPNGDLAHHERRFFGDGLFHDMGIAKCVDDEKLLSLHAKYDDIRRSEPAESYLTPIVARAFQMVCKIALINAVARDPYSLPPKINTVDLAFAEKMVDNNIERFKEALDTLVFENKYDEKYMKIKLLIQKEGEITTSDIGRKIRGTDSRMRIQILNDLTEFGLITSTVKLDSGKKPKTVYRWVGNEESRY